jgi:predicted pyridoxine 5'-phosphate oxidase superfamily flavin-nucleotide-binding protein
MSARFAELLFTDNVIAQQKHYGSPSSTRGRVLAGSPPDALGEAEREFIESRDTFYIATVTETGWPYVQHRGGPKGFLRVMDPHTLGFADFRGNRQLISTGNLAGTNRVAMILMDYASRTRLKLLATARVVDRRGEPDLVASLEVPGYPALVERAMILNVEGFDWNCPQHITPRFTEEEIQAAIGPRIEEMVAARVAEVLKSREPGGSHPTG